MNLSRQRKLSRDRRKRGRRGDRSGRIGSNDGTKTHRERCGNRTIRALHKSGRLESVDDVLIETVRYTSKQLDQLPPSTSAASKASLVRAHLAAVKLLVRGNDAIDDGGISEIIAALSTPPSYPSSDNGMGWQPPEG
jgi:hypothetical protein